MNILAGPPAGRRVKADKRSSRQKPAGTRRPARRLKNWDIYIYI